MAVTVNDILHINKLADAVVAAGSRGLNKTVRRIATIEKPFLDHPDYCYEVVRPGDLYVSKLYVFQGHKEKLYEEIEFMRRTKGSGLITHKEVLPFLDEEVLRRADLYHIPIIAIDDDYGFTALNYSIIDLILKDEIAQVHVANLQRILSSNLSEEIIRKHILDIIPDLAENMQAVYLSTEEVISRNIFKIDQSDLLLPLFSGLLYVASSDDKAAIDRKKKGFIANVKHSFVSYHVGISRCHTNLECVKTAILESIYAEAFGRFSEKPICGYDDLGTFALLLEMKNDPLLELFWRRFYEPILQYDGENKLDLVRVLELFIVSGGDYAAVCQKLFIHETTVRYRMNKIHDLLKYKNANEFYADARTAVYSNWILHDAILQKLKAA
ncbi:PucR family transcriptional regulator ligand-binding domain-containing protein [Emergencia timonensis]|uniref:PucR family transcriptional regulator n=1 Tax=Emergencia timonensis TaxID=1776384 RepID=UPI003993EFB7